MRKKPELNSLVASQQAEESLKKAAALNPEFTSVLGNYGLHVPEYAPMLRTIKDKDIDYGMSKRAKEEIRLLSYSKEGHELSEKVIKRNIAMLVYRLKVKLSQLLKNPEWLKALEDHEEREDNRLGVEEDAMAIKGEPGDLTKLIRQRFEADLIKNIVGGSILTATSNPRNKVKMTQELAVHPAERLVLLDKEKNNIDTTINNLVIDPGMISDTLLRNLGLDRYIPAKKLSKLKKLEKRAEAIPELRKKLVDLKPIVLENSKLIDDRYSRTFATFDGYVLGTTQTLKGKQLFRANLTDAVNRLRHIEEGYSEEIKKLRGFNDVVKNVDYKITNEWEKVRNNGELENIKEKMTNLANSLRYVTNDFKKEMLALVQECVTMETTFTRKVKDPKTKEVRTETAVRLNPTSKKAKLVMVPVNIANRILEIGRIRQYISEDRTRLESVKADHELIPFRQLKEYIEQKALEGRSKNKSIPINPIMEEKEKLALKERLFQQRMDFSAYKRGLVLEPYRCFARQLSLKLQDAERVLEQPDVKRKDVTEAITKVYVLLKLQDFWSKIQDIYERFLARKELPYFLQLRDELKNLRNDFRGKQVAASIRTTEFDALYREKFYPLLENLINLAEEGKKSMRDKDEDAARKIKGAMYKAVADIDIVKLVSPSVVGAL